MNSQYLGSAGDPGGGSSYNSHVTTRREFLCILALPPIYGQQSKREMFADGEAYERFMGRWSRILAPLLVDFAEIAGTGRVLDVGSGTGSLTFAIAERKPKCDVVGVDPSKEYVAYATSRIPAGVRASFEIGDAQRLRFDRAAFESSLSLLVFNFIPDSAQALRELIRVTRPGGKIAVAVWDYGGAMRMLRVFWDAAASRDPEAEALDEKHMPLCRSGELRELWRRGGLADIDEQPLDFTMRFSSFPDYWDPFLLGQGPAGGYVRRLDDARRSALRDDVKRRLQVSSENSAFDLPARAWAVRGTVPVRD